MQNKIHFAISHQTAAEIIYSRADHTQEHMGLTSWKNSPDGKVLKSDVSIAKNYLSKDELEDLARIVNAFLDLAEGRAKRHIPMTMQDWAERIDKFCWQMIGTFWRTLEEFPWRLQKNMQKLSMKNIGLFKIGYLNRILIKCS